MLHKAIKYKFIHFLQENDMYNRYIELLENGSEGYNIDTKIKSALDRYESLIASAFIWPKEESSLWFELDCKWQKICKGT